MISTNALSLFLFKHDQNGVCDRNLCSIQESIRLYKMAVYNFKRVCAYFPNPALLTKSVTPREVQVMYSHVYVGNKSLRETVTTFALEVLLEALTVVTIDVERASVVSSVHIPLPTTKLLLHTAIGDLSKSKKLCNWAALNAVFVLPFLTKGIVFKGESTTGELLNTSPPPKIMHHLSL